MVTRTRLNVTLQVHCLSCFSKESTVQSGPGPPYYRRFTIALRHTTLDRASLDEGSVRRRDLYLTTNNTHKRQASMSPAGLEPAIQTSDRPQTYAFMFRRMSAIFMQSMHQCIEISTESRQYITTSIYYVYCSDIWGEFY